MNVLYTNHQPLTDIKSINYYSNKMSKYYYYLLYISDFTEEKTETEKG